MVSTVQTNPAVELRTLGSSQVQVPVIGLGTWKYAGGIEPLQAGVDGGAWLIDTAEIYGTEETVGKAIQGRRDRIFLATKVAPRNFRRAALIAAAETSLRKLGTDYLDLYQLHWPNMVVPIEETMGALEQLADAGKIRFIGVSNFSVSQLAKAQAALTKHKIVSNQVRYSLFDRTIERDLLDYCRRTEVTVMAYSPLGTVFSQTKSADPEGVLAQVAKAEGRSEAQIALNWLIAKENVITIPKASTAAHALDNCGAAGWRLSPDQYRLLENKIQCVRHGWAWSAVKSGKRYVAQSLGRGL